MQLPIQEVWGGAWDPASTASSQVVVMLRSPHPTLSHNSLERGIFGTGWELDEAASWLMETTKKASSWFISDRLLCWSQGDGRAFSACTAWAPRATQTRCWAELVERPQGRPIRASGGDPCPVTTGQDTQRPLPSIRKESVSQRHSGGGEWRSLSAQGGSIHFLGCCNMWHKLRGLKQREYILSPFWGPENWNKVSKGCSLSRAPGGMPILAFSTSSGCHAPVCPAPYHLPSAMARFPGGDPVFILDTHNTLTVLCLRMSDHC